MLCMVDLTKRSDMKNYLKNEKTLPELFFFDVVTSIVPFLRAPSTEKVWLTV
jgi:hypothetical protein